MAQKKKTPAPPRRVQAPKRRTATSKSGDRRVLFGILGASAIVLVIGAVAFLSLSGGSSASGDASVKSAMLAAGCSFKTVATQPIKKGEIHVPDGTKVTYNTYPPSGGSHYSSAAIWNFYTTPVEPRMVVHNQEHGGVILWWGPQTPAATVAKLRSFYDSSPVAMLGTPLETLGKRVAITAWTGDSSRYGSDSNYYGFGHAAVCPGFSKTAFTKFRDTYRGHGPEGIPMSSDQPGT